MRFLKICLLLLAGVFSLETLYAGLSDVNTDKISLIKDINKKYAATFRIHNNGARSFCVAYNIVNGKETCSYGLFFPKNSPYSDESVVKLATRLHYFNGVGLNRRTECAKTKDECSSEIVEKVVASFNGIDCNKKTCKFVATGTVDANCLPVFTATAPAPVPGRPPSADIKSYSVIALEDLKEATCAKGKSCFAIDHSQSMKSINRVLYDKDRNRITMFLVGEDEPITFLIGRLKDDKGQPTDVPTASIFFPYSFSNQLPSNYGIVALVDVNKKQHLFPLSLYSSSGYTTDGPANINGYITPVEEIKEKDGKKYKIFKGLYFNPCYTDGKHGINCTSTSPAAAVVEAKYIEEGYTVDEFKPIIELKGGATGASVCYM
jgi:hypothetical protein